MSRFTSLVYSTVAYLAFVGVFLYLIAFVADHFVPRTIDRGVETGSTMGAVLVNLGLIALFGLQHSVMARAGFKRWWTRIVPEPIERSTYVLFSSIFLVLLLALWRPIPATVWHVESAVAVAALWTIFAFGWGLLFVSTYLISHAHLFGLKQAFQHWRGRHLADPEFQTPGPYRHLRHPMMLGFLLGFWATPHMTTGHLLFAVAMSAYIFVGCRFEERALEGEFGGLYLEYKRRVPMLVPRLRTESDLVGQIESAVASRSGR